MSGAFKQFCDDNGFLPLFEFLSAIRDFKICSPDLSEAVAKNICQTFIDGGKIQLSRSVVESIENKLKSEKIIRNNLFDDVEVDLATEIDCALKQLINTGSFIDSYFSSKCCLEDRSMNVLTPIAK
jgi:hypothetical protein